MKTGPIARAIRAEIRHELMRVGKPSTWRQMDLRIQYMNDLFETSAWGYPWATTNNEYILMLCLAYEVARSEGI